MNKKLLRQCPICGEKNGTVLHTQYFALEQDSLLPSEFDIVSCIQCGFTFSDTPASQRMYDEFYALQSKYEDKKTGSGGGFTAYDKERIGKMSDEIVRWCPSKNSAVLDLGCANGGLLRTLKERGYTNLQGIDPSSRCVEETLSAGISCEQSTIFNTWDVLQKKYDFVVLSHVIEHICDLKAAMQALSKLQNQNGLLYVEVPDAARYDKFFKAPFHFFDVEHINHFDAASLSNLGHLGGYKAVTSGSKELGVSDNELYPAIFTVFEKTFSSAAHSSIVKYIELSNKNLEDENMLIADLVTSQKEVIVFGVGSYTRRMLATADLSKCNIVCFVDNDTSKQGQECAGKKINSADVIKNFSGTVVICSAIHSLEIERQVSEINPNIPRVVMR